MKSVLIATPAYQFITPETRHTIKNLCAKTKSLKVLEPYEMYNHSLIPHARNDIVKAFLGTKADYLFFIDADVFLKHEKDHGALDRLASHQKPVISGIYVCKNPPFVPAVLSYERLEKNDFYERWDEYPNPKEVYMTVTGFTLIQRDVLEKLGEFCFNLAAPEDKRFDPASQLPEDYSFCQRVRKEGWKLWVDHSIELFHLGVYGYSLTDFYYTAEGVLRLKPGDKLPPTKSKIG
jgi:GT2 family glycosyltransferase